MRAVSVVMLHEDVEDPLKMLVVQDEQLIETLWLLCRPVDRMKRLVSLVTW